MPGMGLVTASREGLQLTMEYLPTRVLVGYGSPKRLGAAEAVVAFTYSSSDAGLIEKFGKEVRRLNRTPVVAFFERNVQLVMSVAPIPAPWVPLLAELPGVGASAHGIKKWAITSTAEIFRNSMDESVEIFHRCFERDGFFRLLLLDENAQGEHGGAPFLYFRVKELQKEFQSPV